ncbi:hypothetical protein CRE_20056 [Caenorhabditis remanei]|uniref:Uncharacterized protein n=1 Tax=Caenorhabditis remanei TaxID=31234 RepID=E3NHH7_CAERE|nr:hypothetical protein CRE_20056 [Caenorhabditis remanei]
MRMNLLPSWTLKEAQVKRNNGIMAHAPTLTEDTASVNEPSSSKNAPGFNQLRNTLYLIRRGPQDRSQNWWKKAPPTTTTL